MFCSCCCAVVTSRLEDLVARLPRVASLLVAVGVAFGGERGELLLLTERALRRGGMVRVFAAGDDF